MYHQFAWNLNIFQNKKEQKNAISRLKASSREKSNTVLKPPQHDQQYSQKKKLANRKIVTWCNANFISGDAVLRETVVLTFFFKNIFKYPKREREL